VAFVGLGINLALGILYTWSVISGGVPDAWGWNEMEKSLPYSVACLVFCIVMGPAGRLQDVLSPRLVAAVGGVLVGLGMVVASFTTSPLGYIIGFGVLAGSGIGFGYAAATPPAVKWFPKARTGMIAGLVVSGFGLASVYAAPLSAWLIQELGLPWTLRILGMAFLGVVVGLSFLLRPPRKDEEPREEGAQTAHAGAARKEDFSPMEMLKTSQFYILWFMFACGAGAGLMIISKLKAIADKQVGITLGFMFVASLAVGNGGGRILTGFLSDKIGRKVTLFSCFVMQAGLVFLLSMTQKGTVLADVWFLGLLSALIGANYGANLALFPSITKDFYGLRNFGMNYGLVFTAWGVGGFVLALVAGQVYDIYQTFSVAYYSASALLVIAAVLTFFVRPVARSEGVGVRSEE
jgi:OFA family oxalate/formate antiporter-like MFS transporter